MRNAPDKTKEFLAEVVKGLGNNPIITLCFFATGREYWETKFAEYSQRFSSMMPKEVKPIFKLAFPDKFVEQVKEADAIMIQGGDDHLLHYWLGQFDVPKIWDNKVVSGSSAGSDVLCQHFWTCDWRQCMDGLAILPIKFIPHYKSDFGADDPRGPIDWEKAYMELSNYGGNLPIYALVEGDYIVMNN